MCLPASYRTIKLHAGHTRMLRLAGAVRQAGRVLKASAEAAEWESVEAARQEAERPVIARVQAVFEAQRRAVLERAEEVLPGLVARHAPAEAEKREGAEPDPLEIASLFDLSAWDDVLDSELREVLEELMETAYGVGGVRVGIGVGTYAPSPFAEEVLAEVLGKAKGMNATTQSEVGRLVAGGLKEGLSAADIAARLSERFTEWQAWRAPLVAQTAGTALFEAGQQDTFREAGVGEHRWLSQRDGKVRPSHAQGTGVDGEERPLGEPFSNGCRFPGDPEAPAREVVGCRCTTIPLVPSASASKTAVQPDGLLTTEGEVIDLGELNDRELQRVEVSLRDYNIRMAHAAGEKSLSALAERFHVSESTARRAIWGS